MKDDFAGFCVVIVFLVFLTEPVVRAEFKLPVNILKRASIVIDPGKEENLELQPIHAYPRKHQGMLGIGLLLRTTLRYTYHLGDHDQDKSV